MSKLRVLDLFSGIGGFSLGLERTGGFETVAFCEIEDFPRRVLAKHWPIVPCYTDVRELTGERLAADGIAVDVICGGFPCQDISLAGSGAGLDGERSGLWSEIARLVGELRPQFLVVENVSALLGRGLDRVLADLAALGYDAEWHCIPASAVGARHRRDRFWLVANPGVGRCDRTASRQMEQPGRTQTQRASNDVAHPEGFSGGAGLRETGSFGDRHITSNSGGDVAHAISERRAETGSGPRWGGLAGCCPAVEHEWNAEPDVGRVAHGVPARVDRLKALGNAVVPQIPELIGRAILASLEQQRRAA